ncbi:MAG: recombination regulator RecX [Actinomycetota bacterium]|nr:recombination regulator RecX [Actinomycetota bacterium]
MDIEGPDQSLPAPSRSCADRSELQDSSSCVPPEVPFQSAEAWLATRGVDRTPARTQREEAPAQGLTGPVPSQLSGAPQERRERSLRSPKTATGQGREPNLEDRVAEAAAYARRSTGQAPKSEQRLREALARRGYSTAIVEAALDRCRSDGTVDDRAFARALVEEARSKGHAPRRIQADLDKRGLPADIVAAALATVGDCDPEAAAYSVAVTRAAKLRGVDAQTAYRRLIGYLARRGHEESLARRVARQAIFNDREPRRVAER